MENFGWPCYEGVGRQAGYDGANLSICENLYNTPGAVTPPYFAYHHNSRVVTNESCPTGSSSIAGLDFQFAAPDSSYPAEYDGALFFADYSRDCIWVMPKGADGQPAPGQVRTFVAGAANPVNLEIGPDGNLYYADFDGGTIRRIGYANQPIAVAAATPTTGSAPLTVSFDGRGSSDPNGDTLTYAWDLDNDGAYDDAATAQATRTYTTAGTYVASLRVTDARRVVRHRLGHDHGERQHPTDGHHRHAGRRHHLEGRRHHHLLRIGNRCAGRRPSGVGAQVGTDPEPLPVHLPLRIWCRPLTAWPAARSAPPTTSTRPTWSCAHRDRLGRSHPHRSVRLDPRTVVLTFQTSPGASP